MTYDLDQLARLEQERDKWLQLFNQSEQFQNGPIKRAEKAEAERDALQRRVDKAVEYLRGVRDYEGVVQGALVRLTVQGVLKRLTEEPTK